MTVSSIIGHERQLEYLNKAFQKGRISHAYLFYGPEGVGKFTVAKYFAGLFDNPEIIILDRGHTLVSEKEERKDIPIEDIRELKRRLSLAPEGARWRIIIINEAEKLSHPAADAFLKLLEEPGTQTVFILITASRESLPQTIISRSVPIRFSLVPDNVIANAVKQSLGIAASPEEILLFTSGRPGVMMKILEDEEYFNEERKLIKEIASLLKGGALPDAFLLSAKAAGDEEKRRKVIEYVMRITRKRMLDNKETGGASRDAVALKKISRIADILETTNVNPRLALDVMFLEVIGDSNMRISLE